MLWDWQLFWSLSWIKGCLLLPVVEEHRHSFPLSLMFWPPTDQALYSNVLWMARECYTRCFFCRPDGSLDVSLSPAWPHSSLGRLVFDVPLWEEFFSLISCPSHFWHQHDAVAFFAKERSQEMKVDHRSAFYEFNMFPIILSVLAAGQHKSQCNIVSPQKVCISMFLAVLPVLFWSLCYALFVLSVCSFQDFLCNPCVPALLHHLSVVPLVSDWPEFLYFGYILNPVWFVCPFSTNCV